MSDQESVQQMIVEERRLTTMIEQLSRDIGRLERAIVERQMALDTLKEELKKPLEGKEVLVPIGGEVFIYAATTSLDRVLVNIGAGVFMVQKRKKAQELLQSKIDTFENAHQERNSVLQDLRRRHEQITTVLMEYQARTQQLG